MLRSRRCNFLSRAGTAPKGRLLLRLNLDCRYSNKIGQILNLNQQFVVTYVSLVGTGILLFFNDLNSYNCTGASQCEHFILFLFLAVAAVEYATLICMQVC